MEPSTDKRLRLLGTLDAVEGVLTTFFRLLLGVVLVAVMGVVAFVIIKKPWGAGNQGEWFYFSIAVLFVLGWVMGQFASLGRRKRRRSSPLTFTSSAESKAGTWKLTFGSLPEAAHDGSETPAGVSLRWTNGRLELSRNDPAPLSTSEPADTSALTDRS